MQTTREKLLKIISSERFHLIILGLITLNAVVIGLQTSKEVMEDIGIELKIAEYAILAIFVVEIICRIIAKGKAYFKQGWDLFDFSVIMISLLPHAAGLSIFRSFRVIHSLDMFQISPHMNHIIQALRHIGPSIVNVFLLMFVSFYVLGVIGVELFSEDFPYYFRDLPWSLFTLFRIMVFDDFGRITHEIIDVYPYAWIYFIIVVIILAFVLINLFIAVVVTALQRSINIDKDPVEDKVRKEMKMLQELQVEIQELKELVKSNK